ncbi:hypothetical protein Noda2021_06240 [Candidatus Dependentiae bacterium Noda2021]|nr:hypothetical protein Noda2021_06240 [Candidatus Dependentiae bacterium Noda2021]
MYANTAYAGELALLGSLSYDVADLQRENVLRPLLRRDSIKIGFKELNDYYNQLASPTLELPEVVEKHHPFLDSLMNPMTVVTTSSPVSEPDAEKVRYYYAKHLIEKLAIYKEKLINKHEWLQKQNKLVFLFKKVYSAVSRLALGGACYLVGCFVAKYAVREKQIKNLPTAMGFFAGGSYCLGQAGKYLMSAVYFDDIIDGHLKQTESHLEQIETKKEVLEQFNLSIEHKLNPSTDSETPILPESQSDKDPSEKEI